jgi:AcrR family transcriptional regulator
VRAAAKTTPRTTYHHGDLRNALTEAAVDLARSGGPDAVVLREVARRVGVSATAAYRHFSTHDDLLDEVKSRGLAALAESLTEAVLRVPAEGDPGELAVARFRAAAQGYLAFGEAQPGLFNTAFCHIDHEDDDSDDHQTIPFADSDAYRMLGMLLDDLVEVGLLDPARRPGAEIAAWSAVHGLAVLLLDGPLRHLSAEERAVGLERTIDVVVIGLTGISR